MGTQTFNIFLEYKYIIAFVYVCSEDGELHFAYSQSNIEKKSFKKFF